MYINAKITVEYTVNVSGISSSVVPSIKEIKKDA